GASRLRCARNGDGPGGLPSTGAASPSPHPGGGRTTLQTVLGPACTRPDPQAVHDGSLQSSRLRSSDAASVRLDAPILRSRLWMWLLIVCGLRHSRSAIAALDRPLLARLRISRSRRVSAGLLPACWRIRP